MKPVLDSRQVRVTALWAFSEAFLGGILHGFQLPFTGLILSGFASVCMCLIAHNDFCRGQVIHATILVMITKLMLSPHTPFTAYFAVLLQGLFGEAMFSLRLPYVISCYAISVFALMQSAFQKLIVLTILFGMEGWKAMDEFINSVLQIFHAKPAAYTTYIVGGYLILHFMAGLVAARIALHAPEWTKLKLDVPEIKWRDEKKKKKGKWIYYLIFIILALIIYKIYTEKDFLSFIHSRPLVMLVRASLILVFWFYFISPLLTTLLRSWLMKRKSEFTGEVNDLLALLPDIRRRVQYAWHLSSSASRLHRIPAFVKYTVRLIVS